MKVSEMIEWLKKQEQDAEVEVVECSSHLYSMVANFCKFDPQVHSDLIETGQGKFLLLGDNDD